jgi:hypothetical protein
MLRFTPQIRGICGILSLIYHALLDIPTNETISPNQLHNIFNYFTNLDTYYRIENKLTYNKKI